MPHNLIMPLKAGRVESRSAANFLPYPLTQWPDFIHFQEAIFEQRVLFMAGMAEAKSKGRGEECISQNLRVVQAKTGKKTMVFFPNSQRGEGKRYVFIPRTSSTPPDCTRLKIYAHVSTVDNVEGMTQGKKGGRPVTLRLRSAGELLSQLKTLQIDFLDSDGTSESNDRSLYTLCVH